MAGLVFFLVFFLFFGADSFAQTYKYVDRKGTICFTDNPPSSVFKNGLSNKGQKQSVEVNQRKRARAEIRDIMQLGHEILEEELAKPPGKQNRRLIREMTEILYGDGSSKKSQ